MENVIKKLKAINKEELSEREFYEEVLTALNEMSGVKVNPQAAGELKQTLSNIGCKSYDEWKQEKEEAGEEIEDVAIGLGMDQARISTAVSFVEQFFGDVRFAQGYLVADGKGDSFIKRWLDNSKFKVPYYEVAKEALMNWNGLSEEEALETIENSTFDEIEGKVWAKGSIDYAIKEISSLLSFDEEDKEHLTRVVFEKDSRESHFILRKIRAEMELHGYETSEMIMDTLFAVHDGWVKDNAKKFMAREKKHQHMPSELIGWKEAKADLLFIKPIFEAAGIEVSEEALETEYNDRVKEFFLNRGIRNSYDLEMQFIKGERFYSALKGQDEIISFLENEELTESILIPQIAEKGIGKIEDVRESIINQIAENPNVGDFSRLSAEEIELVEQKVENDIASTRKEYEELREQNSIVSRIMKKSKERNTLKRAVEIEQGKKNKNIQSIDE